MKYVPPDIDIGGGSDDSEHQLVAKLRERITGLTVTDVVDDLPTVDPGWSDHGSIKLVFSDGSTLDCGGWGHDAWGPSIGFREASNQDSNREGA